MIKRYLDRKIGKFVASTLGKTALLILLFLVYLLIFGIVIQEIGGALPTFAMMLFGALFFVWFTKHLFIRKGTVRIWGKGDINKTINTNDSLLEIQETLSCLTCIFCEKQVTEKKRGWCNAPNAPDTDGKYCNTFRSKVTGKIKKEQEKK